MTGSTIPERKSKRNKNKSRIATQIGILNFIFGQNRCAGTLAIWALIQVIDTLD
jgi:hypothetical protein